MTWTVAVCYSNKKNYFNKAKIVYIHILSGHMLLKSGSWKLQRGYTTSGNPSLQESVCAIKYYTKWDNLEIPEIPKHKFQQKNLL